MSSVRQKVLSASALRLELSARNSLRAVAHQHESTFGRVPHVIYGRDEAGHHGNFLDGTYKRICADHSWSKRLRKVYTAGKRVARSGDRERCELDCANSSDALLMNIFCYPKIALHRSLCRFLDIEMGLRPEFGYRPLLAMHQQEVDRTEMDMRLGDLLVEAKLTESDFQRASPERVLRYQGIEEIFELQDLTVRDGMVDSYQLIRGVLAAEQSNSRFVVLCDSRRADLIEKWFAVIRAVRRGELRSRLVLLTWQEVARVLPLRLQTFLEVKYGIGA